MSQKVDSFTFLGVQFLKHEKVPKGYPSGISCTTVGDSGVFSIYKRERVQQVIKLQ